MSDLKFLISGFYSGPSPSAGLGIAKSLRAAWSSAKIIGMDYWSGSSGLHDDCLSERLVFPSWDILDLDNHVDTLKKYAQDHQLISALDIEISWLTKKIKPSANFLMPDQNALSYAEKPFIRIGELLPFKRPKIYLDQGDDQELFDFCRDQSWRVWVKGAFHGAKFAASWRDLTRARDSFNPDGKLRQVSYQQHIRGVEESICFAAFQGKLCGAVHMQKRVITPEGKTWSGKVRPLSDAQYGLLADVLKTINWTGGGELELIRDESDQYWLMEFNPRFPAWIHGSTIAGFNLPAMLVEASHGIKPRGSVKPLTNEFTRVVTEIPVLKALSLPQVQQPIHGDIGMTGKYGASYGTLEKKLIDQENPDNTPAVSPRSLEIDKTEKNAWQASLAHVEQTPKRLTISSLIDDNFKDASELMTLKSNQTKLLVAYSIKTSPEQEYLDAAFQRGLSAEAISMAEVEKALATGWMPEQIILNGPAKWWPRSMVHHPGLKAVFCDSADEFARLLASGRRDKTWGFRLKIPGFNSRFGAELDTFADIRRLVTLIEQMPKDIKLGFHIHLASNLIGNGHWEDAVQSAVHWVQTIALQSQRSISILDLGGGYHPRDLKKFEWKAILEFLHREIPTLEHVVIEPGRALSQNTAIMITSVQDIRKKRGHIQDVVVDTCISELPLARVYPHRMFVIKNGELIALGPGQSRMLGRICMEDDILADSVNFPESLTIGDRLVIADAGAYERSMSYAFGYGRVSPSM